MSRVSGRSAFSAVSELSACSTCSAFSAACSQRGRGYRRGYRRRARGVAGRGRVHLETGATEGMVPEARAHGANFALHAIFAEDAIFALHAIDAKDAIYAIYAIYAIFAE